MELERPERLKKRDRESPVGCECGSPFGTEDKPCPECKFKAMLREVWEIS